MYQRIFKPYHYLSSPLMSLSMRVVFRRVDLFSAALSLMDLQNFALVIPLSPPSH